MKMHLLSSRVLDIVTKEGPVHGVQFFTTHEWPADAVDVKGVKVEKLWANYGTPLFDKVRAFNPPCMIDVVYQIDGKKAVISDVKLVP